MGRGGGAADADRSGLEFPDGARIEGGFGLAPFLLWLRPNLKGEDHPMALTKLLAPCLAAFALLASPPARAAGPASEKAQVVELAITSEGTFPDTVTAKAGQPLKLVITRKTDSTCVNQVVMKDFGVDKPLPLNKPVTVELRPAKAGTYHLVCGMGMNFASLKVQ